MIPNTLVASVMGTWDTQDRHKYRLSAIKMTLKCHFGCEVHLSRNCPRSQPAAIPGATHHSRGRISIELVRVPETLSEEDVRDARQLALTFGGKWFVSIAV